MTRSHFLSVSFETCRSCSIPVVPGSSLREERMPKLPGTEYRSVRRRRCAPIEGLSAQPLQRAIAVEVEEAFDLRLDEESPDGIEDQVGETADKGNDERERDTRVVAHPVAGGVSSACRLSVQRRTSGTASALDALLVENPEDGPALVVLPAEAEAV